MSEMLFGLTGVMEWWTLRTAVPQCLPGFIQN